MRRNIFISIVASIFLLGGASVWADNLLRNSSFELGTEDWAMQRFVVGKPLYLSPELDSENKTHCQFSLKITNPNCDEIRLMSHEVELCPSKNYTLSFYAKSSKPVRVSWGVLGGSAKPHGRHHNQASQSTIISKWQRYEFSFKASLKYYGVVLQWGNIDNKASSATVWLDAIQLEEGGQTPYTPAQDIEAAIALPRRVFIKDEQAYRAELKVVNYTNTAKRWQSIIELTDSYKNKTIATWKREISLERASQQTIELPINTNVISSYKIHGAGLSERNFAVIGKFPDMTLNPDKDFTCGGDEAFSHIFSESGLTTNRKTPYMGFGVRLDEYFKFLSQSGFRLLRSGNSGSAFDWKYIEPEEGKFEWGLIDLLLNKAEANDMHIMPVLGNMPYLRHYSGGTIRTRLPKWLVSKSNIVKRNKSWETIEFPIENWKRYISAYVTRYKGRIKYWEIMNEPHLLMPAEIYIKYLKAAYTTIKSIDPDSTVVGFCTTGDLGGRMVEFIGKAANLGGLKYCDVVSFHPYSTRSELSSPSSKDGINKLKEIVHAHNPSLKLWNTELYFLGEDNNEKKRERNRAYMLVRRMLTDLGEGVGQSLCLGSVHLLDFEMRPHWYEVPVAHLGYGNLVPSEMYVAQNTMARLFSGATPLPSPDWPHGSKAYLFRTITGEELGACWSIYPNVNFELPLPAGVKALDIFGNQMQDSKAIRLGKDPIYLTGKDLSKWLLFANPKADFHCIPEHGIWLIKDGQAGLLIQIRNISNTEVTCPVALILKGAINQQSQKVTIPPLGVYTAFLPCEPEYPHRFTTRQITVQLENKSFSLKPMRRGIAAAGKRITLRNRGNVKKGAQNWSGEKDNSFYFKTDFDDKYFYLTINVFDNKRGERQADFWDNDAIEIFIDAKPFENPVSYAYTLNTYRLFLNPSSGNKTNRIGSSSNLDATQIGWVLKDTDTGYLAEVSVPWKSIGLTGPSEIAFDIAVDDSDAVHRKTQIIWSGRPDNYKNRSQFGLLHLRR